MKTKLIIFTLVIVVVSGAIVFLSRTEIKQDSFAEKREKVLSELYLAIQGAKEQGKYECCIEPACTMCYLGEWIWKDGTCDCDGMIVREEWDKVCPQCINGIKQGKCKSEIGACPIL